MLLDLLPVLAVLFDSIDKLIVLLLVPSTSDSAVVLLIPTILTFSALLFLLDLDSRDTFVLHGLLTDVQLSRFFLHLFVCLNVCNDPLVVTQTPNSHSGVWGLGFGVWGLGFG